MPNRRFDSGLRKLHLAQLDRDLGYAQMRVLGSVVPETDWQRIKRCWHYPPNVVSVTVHDLPPLDHRDVFFSVGPGAGASVAMRRTA